MAFQPLDPLGQTGALTNVAMGGLAPTLQINVASLRIDDPLAMSSPGSNDINSSAALSLGSQQLMGQMLKVMSMMLTGLMLNGYAAGGLPTNFSSNSSGSVGQLDAASGGSSGQVNSSQASSATGNQSAGNAVKSGSKVLVIGDSHTAGAFGDELDRLLRAKGAQVHTVGSSGATADNFITGKGTTVGFADHQMNGQTTKAAAHSTPKLEDLINQDKPDTIIVNLGANFRGAGPAGINKQVSEIGEIAKRHGIKITWVGPPTTRQDQGNSASLDKFDQDMKAAVAPYGNYVSSRPFTPRYNGPDGVHYSGEEAKKWAAGVAGAI